MSRSVEGLVAAIALVLLSPMLAIIGLASAVSTRATPIFRQTRVGRDGRTFEVLKFRTMRPEVSGLGDVTVAGDPRITRLGAFLRGLKLDELPQLYNVLAGDMSFVGPRPDVPGYADRLIGTDRAVLGLRPGMTALSSLLLRREEELLALVDDPKAFNDDVLFPAKTALNLWMVGNRTMWSDLGLILRTVVPLRFQPSLRARADALFDELLAIES